MPANYLPSTETSQPFDYYMALTKILEVRGKGVPVMGDDIDTDRIIPARFMKCVTFDGLGEFAFFDAIKEAANAGNEYPFKSKRFSNGSILISGANFGCGSSREHAPQSLYRAGIRAVVAESYAEIFFGNAITLSMPCLTLSRPELNELASLINQEPETELLIDLQTRTMQAGGKSWKFGMPDSVFHALVEGKWDPIAELLEADAAIGRVAQSLPYVAGY
jgi:3-isopropylmalate/(R)-2-methylmalate dehydratase small subunit